MRFHFLSMILAGLLAGSAAGRLCPQSDLTGDCKVDMLDVQAFALQWLDAGGCSHSGCADFDGLSGIDMTDLAIFAQQWGSRGVALVINEFMASNNSASDINDPQGEYDDWLEIYNYGDTAVDLAGVYLTDDLNEPDKWQVPAGYPAQTTIGPNDFILFWADGDTQDGPLHADFKLSADGEQIALIDTDGTTTIDAITFGDQTTNVSYGRYPDGNDDLRFFATPTPLADNNGAYIGLVERPEFSRKRGFYDTAFDLAIASTTADIQIYYTLDGTEPIENQAPSPTSSPYTGLIHISGTTCLRAAAIKTGWLPSPATTHTYIFGADDAIKSLPVISLVGDPNKVLFEPDGIMAIVGGYYDETGHWQPDGPDSYNNPMQRGIEYERPASAEFIWADGNEFHYDCGIRVRGSGYSRPRYTRGDDWWGCWNRNRFGFTLFFRSSYGEKRFEYPLFPYTKIDRYRSFALRRGHNDSCNPFFKDEWARRLHKEMGAVEVTGSFLNLYLNGDYKFYYNPCGRVDQEFCQEWFNTDNEFDIITSGGIRDGTNVAWNNLVNYAKTHSLFAVTNYQYVAERLDIPAFIDYLILEIYSGNWDWPVNNWYVHRERSDAGKFRFGVWDAEGLADAWALGPDLGLTALSDHFPNWWWETNAGLNNIKDGGMCELFQALKVNADFRQLFADRIHKHFRNGGVLMKAHLDAKFWELADEVSGVIPNVNTYIVDTFIPLREEPVLEDFDANGLFNIELPAPEFRINGLYQHGGYISAGNWLTIIDPCGSGTIYYTLDGNDPRLSGSLSATVLAAEDAAKKVLVPTYDIGTSWRGASEPYNDSAWTAGTGGVGYERSSGYEDFIDTDVETEMYNHNASCCIRIPFTVDPCELNEYETYTLRIRYDDGFVAYINGDGVLGRNTLGAPQWDSNASVLHEASGDFEEFDITNWVPSLQPGANILAIHGLNYSTTSSDFLICAELVAYKSVSAVLSPAAQKYLTPVQLSNSVRARARILTDANEWSALNEAVYALPNVAENLRISEIMYHPKYTGSPDDANAEYIELANVGGSTINLNLVKFTNGIDFTFGPDELAAGQNILVVKDETVFKAKYGAGRYIAGQYTGSLANEGERIRLEDAIGTMIADFRYSDGWRETTDGDGYSLTIINPAEPDPNSYSEKDSWRPSAYINGSPGWNDSGIVPNPGAIVINEVMTHTDVAPDDWIELYNTTAGAIDISGWFISDSDSDVMKYEFAPGTVIGAYDYLVLSEDVNFGQPANGDPGRHVPFALSENGELVRLSSALDANGVLTGYRQTEDFGASENGVSFGRYYKTSTDNFNFVAMSSPTSGSANAYPKVGPVVISEIMYHPDWPTGGWYYDNDQYEYVELYNNGPSSVTLYDYTENEPWRFTDGIDYTFPAAPLTIDPYGHILIVKNPAAFHWRYPGISLSIIFGPYTGWLANDGEKLEFSKPGGLDEFSVRQYIRVERVNYSDGSHPGDNPGDIDPWPTEADGLGSSLTRIDPTLYANDPNNWTADTPTPGF